MLGSPSARSSHSFEPEDLSILGMLINGVRPGEVADVLGMTDKWPAIRRWAILKRVIGSRKPSQPSAARDFLHG